MYITPAAEDDLPRILEIERDTIAPPWMHGSLLGEIYREDSFFAVARGSASDPGDRVQEFSAQGLVCGNGGCAGHAGGSIGVDFPTLGFVILRKMGDEAELLQIAVDKSARRLGVADMLLGAALCYARDNALAPVFLEVRKSNDAAVALYKKHGFKPVRQRKNYYSDPIEDAVVMMLDYRNGQGGGS